MSYIRFSEKSNVYMYLSSWGYQFHLSNCVVDFEGKYDWSVEEPAEALVYMLKLRAAGYFWDGEGDWGIERLKGEIAE